MKEHHNHTLKLRFFPISWILTIFVVGSVITLLKFSKSTIIDIFSIKQYIEVMLDQPLHGWIIFIFLWFITFILLKTEMVINQNEIYTQSLGTKQTIIKKEQVQVVCLYNATMSKNKLFKEILSKKSTTTEVKWRKSIIGITLHPQYRTNYKMPRIELMRFKQQDVDTIIQFMHQHWGLNPKRILGIDQLSMLIRKHKLR